MDDIPIRRRTGSAGLLQYLKSCFLIAIFFFLSLTSARAQESRKVKFSVQPVYPELAKRNNIQGTTRLQVVIAPDGSIKDIKVLGGNPVLVQASVEAVKKWKYETASSESTAVLKFEFRPGQ